MKPWLTALVLAACAGAPAVDDAPRSPSPALAQLEALPDMNGDPLPARADAPRTVVVFFASW